MMSFFSSGIVRLILTVIVLIVIFIIVLRSRKSRSTSPNSLDLMKERLERGEITEEEFESARRRQTP